MKKIRKRSLGYFIFASVLFLTASDAKAQERLDTSRVALSFFTNLEADFHIGLIRGNDIINSTAIVSGRVNALCVEAIHSCLQVGGLIRQFNIPFLGAIPFPRLPTEPINRLHIGVGPQIQFLDWVSLGGSIVRFEHHFSTQHSGYPVGGYYSDAAWEVDLDFAKLLGWEMSQARARFQKSFHVFVDHTGINAERTVISFYPAALRTSVAITARRTIPVDDQVYFKPFWVGDIMINPQPRGQGVVAATLRSLKLFAGWENLPDPRSPGPKRAPNISIPIVGATVGISRH